MPPVTGWAGEGDMAMEGHVSNSAFAVKLEAHQRGQTTPGLSTVGVICGIGLAIGLLILAFPFSDQVAMSLSLLS